MGSKCLFEHVSQRNPQESLKVTQYGNSKDVKYMEIVLWSDDTNARRTLQIYAVEPDTVTQVFESIRTDNCGDFNWHDYKSAIDMLFQEDCSELSYYKVGEDCQIIVDEIPEEYEPISTRIITIDAGGISMQYPIESAAYGQKVTDDLFSEIQTISEIYKENPKDFIAKIQTYRDEKVAEYNETHPYFEELLTEEPQRELPELEF